MKYFLLFLTMSLFFACVPLEPKQESEPTPTTTTYYFKDDAGEGHLIDAFKPPKKVKIDKRLSSTENLQIIQAHTRVTRRNKSDVFSFNFEGLDRVITHREYSGVLTGNKVFVPYYKEYTTKHFAWGLFVLGIVFFLYHFLAVYHWYTNVPLLWIGFDSEKRIGSITLFFAQLLGVVFIVTAGILVINGVFLLDISDTTYQILVYSMTSSLVLCFCFILGSFADQDFKLPFSFLVLAIISVVSYYLLGASSYIVFYFSSIPAFAGIVGGAVVHFRKEQKENKEWIPERRYQVIIKNKHGK